MYIFTYTKLCNPFQILACQDPHGARWYYRRVLPPLGQDGHSLDGDWDDLCVCVYTDPAYTSCGSGLHSKRVLPREIRGARSQGMVHM